MAETHDDPDEERERRHHAQRFESLSQLSGGLAHDFNNLLTIIQGNLQALSEMGSVQGDPDCVPLVTAALRASQRGADLTHKLLAVSRRQPLAPSPVDVPALLRSLLALLQRTLPAQLRVTASVAPGCPPCIADPVLLESALLNIALNARDAMPDGGTLAFAVAVCGDLPAAVRADLAAAATGIEDYLAISVRDNGCGMSAEVRERAMEPFFTTKPEGRGTGLGLSTACGFVRQSKGAMTLDSAPGEGCCVTLYLPLERRRVARPAPPIDVGLEQLRGLGVMLVDDDLEVLAIVLSHLRAIGCEVRAYGTAEHVLQALESEPAPALLISDVELDGGMNGTELARIVARRWPGVALMLMSGQRVELEAHAAPPPPVLAKPFSRDELARAMLDALARPGPGPARLGAA